MSDPTYEFRSSLRRGNAGYRLTDDAIVGRDGSLPLSELASLRLYTVPGMQSLANGTVARPSRRCTIRARDGRKIALSSLHFLGLGRFEDRTATFVPFVRALVARLAARYPDVELLAGMPPALWWLWFACFGSIAAACALALLGTLAVIASGQMSWLSAGFLLAIVVIGIGPVQYVRTLWRSRPRRLDPNEI
jgi:hypothetical protein